MPAKKPKEDKKAKESKILVPPKAIMLKTGSLSDEEDTEYLPDLSRRARYTVGFLRNMYILCTDNIEFFASRFNVDVLAIQNFVIRGNWEQLREQNRSNTVSMLQAHLISNVVESLQNELKQQEILNRANKQKLQEAEAHFQKYGDYFLRKEGGDEFMLDPYGEKIVIGSVYGVVNKERAIKSQTLINGLTKILHETTLQDVNLVKDSPKAPKQLPPPGQKQILPVEVIDLAEYGFEPEK